MSEKARPFLFKTGTTTYKAPRLRFANGTLTFVAGEAVYTAPGGGGGTDHATLTHLGWSASGHTGTANRVAGFDGSGAAAYLTGRDVCNFVLTTRGDIMYRDATEATRLPIGSANRLLMSNGTDPAWASPADVRTALDLATYYQPLDAGLTSLTAADASAGLPYVSGANTWASATYSGMLSVVSSAWKVVGLRESGGQDLTMGAVADGAVLVRSGSTVVGSSELSSGSGLGMALWAGSGANYDVTLDGSTAVAWGSWSTIGGVRTLTVTAAACVEIRTLTVDFTSYSNIAILTKGAEFTVQVLTSTGGTGTLYSDFGGSDASGATGGGGATQVSALSPCGPGQSGANGRSTAGVGNAAGTYNHGLNMGGTGGAGGAVGASAGGTGGTFTRSYTDGYSSYGSLMAILQRGYAQAWVSGTSQSQYQLSGGAGGGGGANQITGSSGGGGGGAGTQRWFIGRNEMAGGCTFSVRVLGGNGAAAAGQSGAGTGGGGGGGGGGKIDIVIGENNGTVELYAMGGVGGAGASADADVGAGGVGGNGGRIVCVWGAGTAPTATVTGGAGGMGSNGVQAASGSTGTAVVVQAVLP